jgi:hypothetical protein
MYYIYHIKKVKIGCSVNPNKRVKAQGYTEYEILEQHLDIDIASKREIELQNEYGLTEKYSKTDYKTFIKNRYSFNGTEIHSFKKGCKPWNKGIKCSYKEKCGNGSRDRKQTDEEKQKRRNSALKSNTTDEYRKQQSEIIKEWWKLRKLNLL